MTLLAFACLVALLFVGVCCGIVWAFSDDREG